MKPNLQETLKILDVTAAHILDIVKLSTKCTASWNYMHIIYIYIIYMYNYIYIYTHLYTVYTVYTDLTKTGGVHNSWCDNL